MSASTITSLAGAIAMLMTRECSDADQLADLATVLRILREAVRDEETLERMDWLIADVSHLTTVHEQDEAVDADNEHRRRLEQARATTVA